MYGNEAKACIGPCRSGQVLAEMDGKQAWKFTDQDATCPNVLMSLEKVLRVDSGDVMLYHHYTVSEGQIFSVSRKAYHDIL